MAVVSYKCPNCSGPLTFAADKQMFACDYCRAAFTPNEMEALAEKDPAVQSAEKQESQDTGFSDQVSAYSCPSCGAEIMTDDTTAASTCYYCHNPVVLAGRLSAEYKPDKIIPFAISKAQALEGFRQFCAKRKFLPRDFFSPKQVENIRGIYYPYYLVEAGLDASMRAEGKNVKVWVVNETEYTEVKKFDVQRGGYAFVDGISVSALKKSDHNMLKYVCPFNEEQLRDFEMTYLSGFEAEKRDINKTELSGEVNQILGDTVKQMLQDTITGYGSVSVEDVQYQVISDKWDYALFPVWVLTYKYKNETYVYAMNGQTGKLYGRLPVHSGKMLALGAGVFAAVSGILSLLLIGGGLL